jgi:hypothetical protein
VAASIRLFHFRLAERPGTAADWRERISPLLSISAGEVEEPKTFLIGRECGRLRKLGGMEGFGLASGTRKVPS